MKKNKKVHGKILFGIIVIIPFINILGQNPEPIIKIERVPVVKKTIEENIQNLHEKLPEKLKMLQLESKEEIIIDMGSRHIIGKKGNVLFVEKVRVKLSGDKLSEIVFVYNQTNDAATFRETREFINNNPSEQDCKGLKIVYKNSKGESDEYVLGDVKDEDQKTKTLRNYLHNLDNFVRWMDFYLNKGDIDQRKKIRRILHLGTA